MRIRGDILFEYKGYFYCPWDEYEIDNRKTYHDVKRADKRNNLQHVLEVPLTPYINKMSRDDFVRWIDMGMPTRDEMGGHHLKDHEKYYNKWVSEQLEREIFDV